MSGKARNVSKGSKSELDPFQEVIIVKNGWSKKLGESDERSGGRRSEEWAEGWSHKILERS